MESSLCPPSPGIDPFLSLGSWSIRQCSTPCTCDQYVSIFLWEPSGPWVRSLWQSYFLWGTPLVYSDQYWSCPRELLGLLGILGIPLILINIALTWIPMDSDCQSARQRWQRASFLWNKWNFTFKRAKIFRFLPHDKRDGVGSSWMRRRRKLMETPKRFKVGRLSANDSLGDQCVDQGEGGRQN